MTRDIKGEPLAGYTLAAIALAAVALSAARSAPLSAQGPPPKGPTTIRSGEQTVTLMGCVRGGRFEPDHGANLDIPALLLGQIFESSSGITLVGKRELLVQIRREHDRHRDEITGVLLIPPKAAGSREVNVKTTQIGKRTRVTAGTKNENGGSRNENGEILAAPVQIRVTSVTHHDGPGC